MWNIYRHLLVAVEVVDCKLTGYHNIGTELVESFVEEDMVDHYEYFHIVVVAVLLGLVALEFYLEQYEQLIEQVDQYFLEQVQDLR